MTFALLLAAAATLPPADVSHRATVLELDGQVLDVRFLDVEGRGHKSLVVAVLPDDADRRELRVYGLDDRGLLVSEPSHVAPVLEDVVAYSFADVRDEPGKEVLFFTRGGVFSYSLAVEGLRGNIARMIQEDLVFDVPDTGKLPYWDYVLESGEIVVPGDSSFSLWANGGDGFVERADFEDVVRSRADEPTSVVVRQAVSISVGGSQMSVARDDNDASRMMIAENVRARLNLLSFDRSYRAPALADVNGDGRDDLVVAARGGLCVHVAGPDGIPEQPTRVERLPDYIGIVEGELTDIDRDGDADLVILRSEDAESGFAAETHTLIVAINDGERLLPPEPTQVMRFEAMELRHELTDVDGDGATDLVVRKFDAPSLLGAVTALEFKHSTLLFPGTGKSGGRVFERKPVLKHEQTFDEDSVQGAIVSRKLTHDFDGDGTADLAEVDLVGRVSIRRLRKTSSFFRGDRWELDRDPWKRFEEKGSITSLGVDDYNGDGYGDVISRRARSVLVLLSGGSR